MNWTISTTRVTVVSLDPLDPLELSALLDPTDHQALLADPETVVNLYVSLSHSIY